MEAGAEFLRRWARDELTRGLEVSKALLERFDSFAPSPDPTLPIGAFEGAPGLTREAYEQSIVEWREDDGRRLPYTDLARPARQRVLQFLSSPGRAVLFEEAQATDLRADRSSPSPPPFLIFYREPDAEREETYAVVSSPLDDEGDAQKVVTHANPTFAPWRHVGALLDGIEEHDLPADGAVVPAGDIEALVRRAVGIMMGFGDAGHVFWWSRGWEHMATPDRIRTEPHATEIAWWLSES